MGQSKYRAFISYSHADEKAVQRLLHRLETYVLPTKLRRGDAGSMNDGRLGSFFRDKEELSAGDLPSQITEALAGSDYLIVVCSPNAVQSHWVNKEIVAFKRLYGEGRVLAVIVAGPTDGPSQIDALFPKALRYQLGPDGDLSDTPIEPLAADFRAEKDGPRLGFLKLVAALTKTDLSRLLDRDHQRRQRRVMWVTGVAVSSMLIMGGLTKMALDARQYAEQQQGEAEGMMQFMLTDLRNVLEAVGRLDALSAVGEKIEDYYSRQPLARMDEDNIVQRAETFHLLGDVDQRRGDLASAQKRFDAALAATKALYDKSPDDPSVIFQYSQNAYYQGSNALKAGNFSKAQEAWQLYKDLSYQLLAIDPASKQYKMEVAWASMNVGVVNFSGDVLDIDLVRNEFSVADKIWRELLTDEPENITYLLEYANLREWSADAELYLPSLTGAIKAREQQIKIYEKIHQLKPHHYQASLDSLENKVALARLYDQTGQIARASAMMDVAIIGINLLLKKEPGRADAQLLATNAHARKAALLFNSNDAKWRDAEQHLKLAETHIDATRQTASVTEDDQTAANFRLQQFYVLTARANFLGLKKNYIEAQKMCERALALYDTNPGENTGTIERENVALAMVSIIELEKKMGKDVSSDLIKAKRLITDISTPLSPAAIHLLFRIAVMDDPQSKRVTDLVLRLKQIGFSGRKIDQYLGTQKGE